MEANETVKVVAQNRKARHDYHVIQTYEAGISLLGTEVKSVREGHVNLRDAFARVHEGEVLLYSMGISAYRNRGYTEVDERRVRKLLLNRSEIRKIQRQVLEKGYTLVPLQVYFKGQYLKVELAVVQGKREYDKRVTKEEQQAKRELDREIKNRRKY
ncbi:MAG: SsrA-binding protein SmpB [Calditrichaeota bacterium]|nr:SsrA-binding protein SmpB [Calditrichota bacterium]MCB9368110.1 SsrA-binding protein SmpB [Calditrichota bacterium]